VSTRNFTGDFQLICAITQLIQLTHKDLDRTPHSKLAKFNTYQMEQSNICPSCESCLSAIDSGELAISTISTKVLKIVI